MVFDGDKSCSDYENSPYSWKFELNRVFFLAETLLSY